jgi:hypothetical protein
MPLLPSSPVPIIASVSEHQPTAWPSFFFDLQMLIFIFPAGLFICFRQLTDGHVFIIIYAALASYFAGVMVRLVRCERDEASRMHNERLTLRRLVLLRCSLSRQ